MKPIYFTVRLFVLVYFQYLGNCFFSFDLISLVKFVKHFYFQIQLYTTYRYIAFISLCYPKQYNYTCLFFQMKANVVTYLSLFITQKVECYTFSLILCFLT